VSTLATTLRVPAGSATAARLYPLYARRKMRCVFNTLRTVAGRMANIRTSCNAALVTFYIPCLLCH